MKRTFLTVIATVLVIVFTSGIAYCKEPASPELTLNQAIEIAGQYSKALKKAELEIDRTAEIRSYRYDQLGYVPVDAPVGNPTEIAWARMLSDDLTWRMSAKSASMEEDSLALSVCQKYWDVLKAEDNINTKKAVLRQAEWDLRKARASAQIGLVASLVLSQAQAQAAGAKAEVVTAENSLDVAYAELNNLLGLWPADRPVLVDAVEFVPLKVDNLDASIQRVIETSPSVWLAQERATMQKYLEELMFYTGEYRPYQARKIEVEQAELDAVSAKEAMRLATRSLYYGAMSLEESYRPLADAVGIAEESLRITEIKYELGMVTKADVAAAEAVLAETGQRVQSIVYQHAYTKLTFQKPWAMTR